jgi:hypothetical protein
MNYKEKAEELVSTYKLLLMNEDTECGQEILCTSIAIKCALIAVDECLATCVESMIYFWKEVKQELKNNENGSRMVV